MRSILELGSPKSRVPAILQVPETKEPVGAALLLHGFTARKEEMADLIGRALLARNIATITPDLPLHGERAGGLERLSLENPMGLVLNWRLALREATECIDYLSALPAVDPARIGVVGYSLGSYLSIFVAAEDPRVQSVALVAGGDLPTRTPFAAVVRTIADPMRAVRRLAGRPLLMVNGTRDRTILPEQATTLFGAAKEPKELRWYDGPHWPPRTVVDDVAVWMAQRLSTSSSGRPAQRLA